MSERPIVPKHGGYRKLVAYQLAEVVYDGTVVFTGQHLDPRSRTVDQMVQAARSGKQNIAEGGRASGHSSKSKFKLIGVARASLEELLLDYEDFLRVQGMVLWDKNHENIRKIRPSPDQSDQTDQSDRTDSRITYALYRRYIEELGPENAANTMIVLIHQTNFPLDRLLRRLEQDFLSKGGITEAMYEARKKRKSEGF
ncbi:MAG TPA: four helix bundle suffix domain-containing protein [Fimbriimonadaceae bacterium]|nr:four helix bundle suffix domain-containing protein [Fimbriimonadaceae bacterium]